MAADLCKRAFARATEILGGGEKLAKYLNADVAQLRRWSEAALPPRHVLRSLARLLSYEIAKNNRLQRAANGRRSATGK